MEKKKVIEVQSLVKKYPNVTAVDSISFEVFEGEVFSLVGPNGAGKSTTIEILECLRSPTSGSAKVLGFDVIKSESQIKNRIGVVPQGFNAFERLTVKENIEMIAKTYGSKPDLKKILETLGMYEARNRQFKDLSGGMKQRTGICMALVSDPELLFLDEPTTGLDPQARVETWEVIRSLRKLGKTIILTTHYMEEVERLADRAAVIVAGKIIAMDAVSELVAKQGGGVRIGIKDGNEKAEQILKNATSEVIKTEDGRLVGTFKSRREASKALSALYELGDDFKVEINEPNMDDVFLRLMGSKLNERGELI